MDIEKLEDILLVISYKDEDPDKATVAFNLLYREYSKLLYAGLRKNHGIKDDQFLDAIVNNTFLKIYYNPLFSNPQNEQHKSDRFFKAWIFTIAKNELQDLLQEFKILEINTTNTNEPAFIETFLEIEKVNLDIESINYTLLEDALNILPKRDRDVLRFLYLYQEEGKKTPTSILNELCNYYGITKENIRQIKSRSEKKIIEYFSKHSQLKPLKYAKG